MPAINDRHFSYSYFLLPVRDLNKRLRKLINSDRHSVRAVSSRVIYREYIRVLDDIVFQRGIPTSASPVYHNSCLYSPAPSDIWTSQARQGYFSRLRSGCIRFCSPRGVRVHKAFRSCQTNRCYRHFPYSMHISFHRCHPLLYMRRCNSRTVNLNSRWTSCNMYIRHNAADMLPYWWSHPLFSDEQVVPHIIYNVRWNKRITWLGFFIQPGWAISKTCFSFLCLYIILIIWHVIYRIVNLIIHT